VIANAGILHNSTHLLLMLSAWEGFILHRREIAEALTMLSLLSSCFSPVWIS
jgi:hypothetical protein